MAQNDFDKFMNTQPFDDLDLKLDTDFLDIDLGYSKQSGARIGATIDLTSKPKSDNDVRMAAIELEREKLKLQKEVFLMQKGNANIPPINTGNINTPTTNTTENTTVQEDINEDEIPEFGGKAYLDE